MYVLAEQSVWAWIAVSLGAASAAAVWVLARDHVMPRNLGEVSPGRVWRSGRLTPQSLRRVRERCKVTTIIDLGAYWPGSAAEARMQRAAADLGLMRVSIRGLRGDGTGNPNAYVRAVRELMEQDRGPVLVMCAAGADRTGAAVALYRVVVEGVPLEEALEEAARHQHDARRNPAMHAFVRGHVEAIRLAIRGSGAIPGHPEADVRLNPSEPHVPASVGVA